MTKGTEVKAVFSPEQADALAIVRRTADGFDGGAIINAFALAIGEYVLPGMVTTTGRNMADHRREMQIYMADRMSPASLKRQFQRAACIWEQAAESVRAAYDGSKDDDGKPSMARAYVALAKSFEGLNVRNQYELDVWAKIIEPRADKPALSRVEKAEAALTKAREAEAAETAKAEANSPPKMAEQIVLMIGRDIFGKAERDAIFSALQAAEQREQAKAEAEAAALEARRAEQAEQQAA